MIRAYSAPPMLPGMLLPGLSGGIFVLTYVNKSAAGFPAYLLRNAAPRSGGAELPSSTFAPWQLAQFCWYAAFPATACADVNSGSAGGTAARPGPAGA